MVSYGMVGDDMLSDDVMLGGVVVSLKRRE